MSWVLALNLIAIISYLIFAYHLGFPRNIHETLFYAQDSKEYKEMGDWLFFFSSARCSDIRPWLFPFLVHLFSLLGGDHGIWFMNFILYLLALNFIYSSVLRSCNRSFAIVTFFILLANVSLIEMTFHALTEIPTFFLLSVMVWFFSKKYFVSDEPYFWKGLLFLSSLLALIKPVFSIFLYLAIFCFIIRAFKDPLLRKVRNLFIMAILLIPVFIQLTIMTVGFGKFSISTIGSRTFREYYYSKFFADENHIAFSFSKGPSDTDLVVIKTAIAKMQEGEMIRSVLSQPVRALNIYEDILGLNLRSGSSLMDGEKYPELVAWSINTNLFYLRLHELMMFVLPIILILLRKKKEVLFISLLLFIPLLLIFSTSGISFWQGDRLILPALPLWITLYSLQIFNGYSYLKKMRKE